MAQVTWNIIMSVHLWSIISFIWKIVDFEYIYINAHYVACAGPTDSPFVLPRYEKVFYISRNLTENHHVQLKHWWAHPILKILNSMEISVLGHAALGGPIPLFKPVSIAPKQPWKLLFPGSSKGSFVIQPSTRLNTKSTKWCTEFKFHVKNAGMDWYQCINAS